MLTSSRLVLIFPILVAVLSACVASGGPPPEHTSSDVRSGSVGGPKWPFTARGNEPGWLLVVGDQITLDWAYGQQHMQAPRPAPTTTDNGVRYTVTTQDHDLRIHIEQAVCQDSMTGMPYPYSVEVTIDGTRLHGCGGSPASLLASSQWVVEDIAGKGIVDASHITLNFGADGRLSGYTGCNHYRAHYELTGESLHVESIAVTRRGCAPALGNQEARFLRVLRNTRSFNIDPTGKLIMRSNAGTTLEAYPADTATH